MLFKNQKHIIKNGKNQYLKEIRRNVLEIFTSAIESVDPYNVVRSKINNNKIIFNSEKFDISNYKNIHLIGFGKASIGMAKAVYDSISIKKGAIITNEINNSFKKNGLNVLYGTHPIPSEKNINATNKLINILKNCNKNDLLIVLISGGGSALFCKPRVSLLDLQKVTNLLLKSGADIKEINTIRKHLSYVKGGQLAKLANCTVISFIISDIIGDPIEFIASGPTYPDSTTFIQAKKILEKYDLWLKIPLSTKRIIDEGVAGNIPETPKDKDSAFENVFNFIVANNKMACCAADKKAKELGYKTMILTTLLDGYAKDRGKFLVEKALNYQTNAKKMIFISGGETTVKVKGKGIGGRNQEMVLAGVNKIGKNNIVFSSFSTDGIDGNSTAAGAIADTYTLERAKEKKLNPNIFLKENNSNKFFEKLNDNFITGSTGTNVMDIQLLIKFK
ncbi:MAG: hypothetical protein AYK22_00590 [Thermoplasmatales archaeon SG8-52-3]|nr:MAG: hypothetical protein AYK22_00590 [Thermoplasmatales archaeon SG8-52-3]